MENSLSTTTARPALAGLKGAVVRCAFAAGALLASLLASSAATAQGEPLAWGKYLHRLASGQFETNDLVAPVGLSNVVQVSSGLQHACFLGADGRVQAVGDWTENQTNVPASLTNVLEISAGGYHTLARTLAGAVVAWGANYSSQCYVPASASNSASIAAGGYHSLSLSSNGTLVGWGDNRAGQRTAPAGLSNVVALAAGSFHSLALKANGQVLAWGDNTAGQTNVPGGLSNVVAIAAKDYYSLALKNDGTVLVWGTNAATLHKPPTGLTGVSYLGAGERHVLALRKTGQVVAWGGNTVGQTNVPTAATNCTAVAAGSLHSLVVLGGTGPTLLSTPTSITLLPGATGALAGVALGSPPLSYQWQLGGTNVPGGTSAQLTLTNVGARHTGTYTLVVSNAWGSLSANAAVFVAGTTPFITDSPADSSGVLASPAEFTVEAGGTPPLTYQWQFNGTDLAGASSSRLFFSSLALEQAGSYAVRVSNDYGAITSETFGLAVTLSGVVPAFTLNPTNTSAIIGTPVVLSALADGSMPLAWQWYHNGAVEPGATRRNFSLSQVAASDAGQYHVAVTNRFGASTSAVAVLTAIGQPPTITMQPAGVRIVVSNTASLSVGAAGTAPLQYQWLRFGTNLTSATAASLTLANAQTNQSGDYQVRVTNLYGSVTSAVAVVLIETPNPPVIVVHPLSRTNLVGTTFTLTVVATGEAPLCYQWRRDLVAISGATNSSYTVVNAQTNDSGSYQVVVTNRWAPKYSRSSVVQVTYPPTPPVITGEPQSKTNLLRANCSLVVQHTGTEPLSYQWRKDGSPLADSTHIIGSHSGTLWLVSFGAADVGSYDLTITNVAGAATSTPVTLSLAPTNNCQATFLGQDTTTSGNWKGTYGSSGFIVIGNLTNLPPGVIITPGGTTNSLWADTSVSQALSKATSTNLNERIAANWNNPTNLFFDFISEVPYELSIYSLDWNSLGASQRIDILPAATGTPLATASVSNFTMGKYLRYQVAGSVRVNVTSLKPISTMISGVFFGALTAPAITQQPASRTNAAGTPATFTVTASGRSPLHYQWRFNGGAIAGATNTSLVLPSVGSSNGGSYTAVVTNSLGAITSALATLTVLVPPSIGASPVSQTVAEGADVVFTVSATGSAPLSYQWRKAGVPVGGNTNRLDLLNVHVSDAGQYSVQVTNAVGSATSSTATLSVVVAPQIVTGPVDRTVLAGGDVDFSVTVTGTSPLGYQWRKDGTAIAGATESAYSLSGLTVPGGGVYAVTVSNLAGQASASATLTVVLPVVITAEPTNFTVKVGDPAGFSVAAEGTGPLSYQWCKSGVELAGETLATCALASAQVTDAGNYHVVVSNPYSAATSQVAQLSVALPPEITVQPLDVTVIQGQPASLPATAAGTGPLSYQWVKEGTAVSGATGTELAFASAQAADAGGYALVVTNVWGAATSAVATLTVLVPPNIVTSPLSQMVAEGADVVFTVSATGSAPLSYQWRKGGLPVGGNADRLELFSVQTSDAGEYSVTVSNAAGSAVSDTATLSVVVAPQTVTGPADRTVLAGGDVGFSVTASGTAPLGYQWRKDGSAIAGATASAHSLSGLTVPDGGVYAVTVSNLAGQASASATLTVVLPVVITAEPTNVTVKVGDPAGFSVAAEGTGPLSYQWCKSGVELAGETLATCALASAQVTDAGRYHVVVSNPYSAATSQVAQLSVSLPPEITVPPSDVTVIQGQPASLSATAAGTGPLSYQWVKEGAAVSGATGTELAFVSAQAADAGGYALVVTNVWGAATSAVATLTVLVPPSIGASLVSQTVAEGADVVFTVSATGSAPLSYQWRKDGLPVGGNTNRLELLNVQVADAGEYSVTVSNGAGSAVSDTATLSVVVAPQIVTGPVDRTVLAGGDVNFSVTATGTSPLGYQWRKDGTAIAGATASAYGLTGLTVPDGGVYAVTVSNLAGQASASATLTVVLPVVITAEPTNVTVKVGDPAGFSVAAEGTGPLSYQWCKSGVELAGETLATCALASAQVTDAGSYHVVVSNPYSAATSQVAQLSVALPPEITVPPSDVTLIQGQPASLSATAAGTGPLSYQWLKEGEAVSGATGTELAFVSAQAADAGGYALVVTNAWGAAASAVATLTVLVPPNIVTSPLSQVVAEGADVVLTVSATGSAPLSYQWRKDGLPVGGNANRLELLSVQTSDAGEYSVTVSNAAGSAVSDTATLSVVVAPQIVTGPVDRTVLAGGDVDFSVTATGTSPLGYQWRKDGTAIAGATAAAYSLSGLTVPDGGVHAVTVSNLAGQASASATLTVVLPVVITAEPTNVTVKVGDPAGFSVAAEGTGPLSYQWCRSGVELAGETLATCALASAQVTDAGSYHVVVSNPYSAATSAVATVTVVRPPALVQEPTNSLVLRGQPASLSVAVTGTQPFTYAWWKDGELLPGVSEAALVIPSAQLADAGEYFAVVSNAYGAVTSQVARLEVVIPANILLHPVSQNLATGQTLSLSVVVEGTAPLQRHWFRNGQTIPGADTDTYTIEHSVEGDSGDYTLVVTNAYGSATSQIATVVVTLPPNVPPMAQDDQLLKSGGGVQTIAIAELLANDSDPDGGTITVIGVGAATHRGGTASLSGTTITFTPASPSHLWDSFTYQIQDDRGGSASATVVLQLDGSNNGSGATVVGVSAGADGQELRLTFLGLPNTTYAIEAAEHPGGPWSVVASRTADAQGEFTFTDPIAGSQPSRFYRTARR